MIQAFWYTLAFWLALLITVGIGALLINAVKLIFGAYSPLLNIFSQRQMWVIRGAVLVLASYGLFLLMTVST
jgi:hypothetical protein